MQTAGMMTRGGARRRARMRGTPRIAALMIGMQSLRAGAYTPTGVPSTQPAEPDLTGPHYYNLRYLEDYSYLDEHPEAYDADPFLRFKNIYLGEALRLDLGGEFRARFENRTNQTFGLDDQTSNAQQNYRYLLHGNLRYENFLRVFAQGIFAHVEDQDGPFQPTQENHGDFQQLFVDLKPPDGPLTLRLGRQEFQYGNSRLVGPLEWVSARRRFDAVKLIYESTYLDVDAFYSKPVAVDRTRLDHWDEKNDFYGMYATYKGIPRHGIDAFLFAVDRTEDTPNPNAHTGDQSIYTFGARFWGQTGGWDYDTEISGQWGKWAGDTVQAWAWDLDGGYTFDLPMHPRVGGGVSLASGDENPRDELVQTFNQLYPFNQVCIGILDLFGRQNLNRAYVNLDFWPVPDKLLCALYLHSYWLNEPRDSYYNVGGIPILRDGFGHSGNEMGQELDLWLEWRIDRRSSMVFGYSHFWNGPYVHRRVARDDQPDLFILQYQFRF